MTNDEPVFPVQRSLLSTEALAERLLSKYDLPGRPVCYFWGRGINDTYRVEAEEATWMLRVSPANWRTYDHLETEIELLQFLKQHHIIAPQPVSRPDGTYIEILNAPEGPRFAVLFTFVPGKSADPFTEVSSHRYGQAIAKFHLATDVFPVDRPCFRFEPQTMVDEPLARLKPFMAAHRTDYDFLLDLGAQLKAKAAQLPRPPSAYGMCHGDVNNSNIHFIDQTDWALLDFEYIGYGWRVFDIGNFINNTFYLDLPERKQRALGNAFVAGYQSIRPLSQAELDALPAFVLLRQYWMWGIGVKNLPNYSFRLFQWWIFEKSLPFVMRWAKEKL